MKTNFIFLFLMLPFLATSQEATFFTDLEEMIARNVDQIVSLGEAIPESDFTWSPAEEVRNVGEAMLHVASANYAIMSLLGASLPEGLNPMEMESSIEGKEKIIEAVKNSFDFVTTNMKTMEESNLKEKVETPFGTFSKRQMLLVVYEHSGEHKGQLIAYARSLGITPPWSE